MYSFPPSVSPVGHGVHDVLQHVPMGGPGPGPLDHPIEVLFSHGGELGLWFGCKDVNGPKTVTGIKAGSQAANIPQLKPFFTDAGQPKPSGQLELVRVNETAVRHLPFEDALSAIKDAGRPLTLTLMRTQQYAAQQPYGRVPAALGPAGSISNDQVGGGAGTAAAAGYPPYGVGAIGAPLGGMSGMYTAGMGFPPQQQGMAGQVFGAAPVNGQNTY